MIYMMILKNIKKILKTVRILTLHAIKCMRKDKKKTKEWKTKATLFISNTPVGLDL